MKDGGWSKGLDSFKTCAICKQIFIVRKNAKTTDTRNLCYQCRRNVKQTIREFGS